MPLITQITLLLVNMKILLPVKLVGSVVIILLIGYQLFGTSSLGSRLGIPSYDTFYKEPRDVLASRVESAAEAQQDAAQEFTSALEKFKSVTSFDGGELEKQFNILNNAFEASEESALRVSRRVDAVVTASNRLLDEWGDELEQYHDAGLRRKAQAQFDQTRSQSNQLIDKMRAAEEKIEPVLGAFRDQVLFLKHNLNMQAINSVDQESTQIEAEVEALINEMKASVAEAERFVAELSKQS